MTTIPRTAAFGLAVAKAVVEQYPAKPVRWIGQYINTETGKPAQISDADMNAVGALLETAVVTVTWPGAGATVVYGVRRTTASEDVIYVDSNRTAAEERVAATPGTELVCGYRIDWTGDWLPVEDGA